MKVTIDSNDPLSEALRVLGAMYNVTLVVDATTSGPTNTVGPTNGKAPSRRSAKKAARNGRATKAKRAAPARAARRSAGAASAPSAPELRSWARQQGYQVGNRGRMPAAVVAAYREAHPS